MMKKKLCYTSGRNGSGSMKSETSQYRGCLRYWEPVCLSG